MPNVQQGENIGYTFFFVGDNHRLQFVTIANSDNDYDKVSNLERNGVFRINIGVSKETFNKLNINQLGEDIDYSVPNVFLPHPHYAQQHFVCILNPIDDNLEKTMRLIIEAHSISESRLQRKKG